MWFHVGGEWELNARRPIRVAREDSELCLSAFPLGLLSSGLPFRSSALGLGFGQL